MGGDQEKFESFILPDITKVDVKKITNFSQSAPQWRMINKGLNLQGKCKNKKCPSAYNKMVWTNLGYGTFHMSETVYKCKCPICGQFTKGNKKIGLYKCKLNGRGMKAIKNNQQETQDTDDENDKGDQTTEQEKEIQFQRIEVTDDNGFLKMDGTNGVFIKQRYMTLQISI